MSNVHAPTYLNWSPMALCTSILQIGSFRRYQVTVHIQQKKQCNQTIKAQENSIVWFFCFFCDDSTYRKTLFLLSWQEGHAQTLQYLLDKGAAINKQDKNGRTGKIIFDCSYHLD